MTDSAEPPDLARPGAHGKPSPSLLLRAASSVVLMPRPEARLTLLRHVVPPICLAPMENRLNGHDASLRIVSVDYAPITDSKPRQVARPLQPLHIALIQLDIAVDRLDHPHAGGLIKPLQVAKRAIRIGRASTQMPSSLFTSSEVWVRPAR